MLSYKLDFSCCVNKDGFCQFSPRDPTPWILFNVIRNLWLDSKIPDVILKSPDYHIMTVTRKMDPLI